MGADGDEKDACEGAFVLVERWATDFVRGDVIAGCVDGIHARRT
jgi:hypothetical protein